ncbi:MAG TPA: DUF4097 family beta strand repeat-containing protein [Gammaproteobacteria bacterium]|nr:DUF4097 family beta strand repeat-containing protein [Gammaproteobacteria bacterium]
MSLRTSTLICVALMAGLAAGPVAAAQSFTKSATYRNPAIKAGGSLDLTNLVGHVTVVAAGDGVLAVDSHVVAAAGSDQGAQALAGKINIETKVSGNQVTMFVHYPLDDYTTYYYAHGSGFVIGMGETSTSYEDTRVHITNGTFGSGANLHVDLTVHAPKGLTVNIENKVGKIDASGVDSSLALKSASGDIQAKDGSGSLSAETGSGDVTVDTQSGAVTLHSGSGDLEMRHQKGGDVLVKTGSGDVKLEDIAGTVSGGTGSGDVELRKYTGNGVELDTGSGGITIDDASGSMKLSAGSGDIKATGLTATKVIETSTGSGDVTLSGDLGDLVRLTSESGSGSIVIHTSRVPSLHITATSDSGDVDVDLPGMQNVSAHHHSIRADVNGGKGSAQLEAGSGDVTFSKD